MSEGNRRKGKTVDTASSVSNLQDPNTAWLQMLVSIINNHWTLQNIGIQNNGLPWTVESFNSLTSENMVKLMAFMANQLIPGSNIQANHSYVPGTDAPIWDVPRDNGIDLVYRALRNVIPEDFEAFHYSVLLLPQQNLAKTKAVITYVFRMLRMWDNRKDQYLQVEREVLEREEDEADLNLLAQQLENEEQFRADAERDLPKLQEEYQLACQDTELERAQLVAAQERELIAKTKYNKFEKLISSMEQQRDGIKRELTRHKDQIVEDAGLLAGAVNDTSEKLTEEKEIGHELRGTIQKTTDQINSFDKVTASAKKLRNALEEGVSGLELLKAKKAELETLNAYSGTKSLENELFALKKQHEEVLHQSRSLEDGAKETIQSLKKQTADVVERHLPQVRSQIEDGKAQMSTMNNRIQTLGVTLDRIQEQVDSGTEHLKNVMAQQQDENKKFREKARRVRETYGSYPQV